MRRLIALDTIPNSMPTSTSRFNNFERLLLATLEIPPGLCLEWYCEDITPWFRYSTFSLSQSLLCVCFYFALSDPLKAIVFSGSSVAKYTSFVTSYSEKSFRESFFSRTCSFKIRSLCFAKLKCARAETSSSDIFNNLDSISWSTMVDLLFVILMTTIEIKAKARRGGEVWKSRDFTTKLIIFNPIAFLIATFSLF